MLVHQRRRPDPLDWEWLGYRVEPGGILIGKDDRPSHVRDEMGGFGWLPVILTEVVEMTGSRHEPMRIPRPHARAHQRRFGIAHPTVYFLDLHYAGEEKPMTGTHPGFKVRWLVRAYWNTLRAGYRPSGRVRTRPHPDMPGRVQVRIPAKAKGPHGAPWKGKPIYRSREEP